MTQADGQIPCCWLRDVMKNDYITSNLRLKLRVPYQFTNSLVYRQNNFKICMRHKDLWKSNHCEIKLIAGSYQAPCPKTILQSYNNQDSMVLAQKQKYQINGAGWKPLWGTYPPTHEYLTFDKERQEYNEKTVSSISGTRKTGQLHLK